MTSAGDYLWRDGSHPFDLPLIKARKVKPEDIQPIRDADDPDVQPTDWLTLQWYHSDTHGEPDYSVYSTCSAANFDDVFIAVEVRRDGLFIPGLKYAD